MKDKNNAPKFCSVIEKEKDILQIMIDSAKNVHLVYLDRDFNFVRVNEAYADTCGYKPEEMTGKNHFALYPNEENEAIFRRVRDTGISARFHDKPFVFPDQSERGITYWDWTLEPVVNIAGKVVGLVFSLVETTERKKAEENLRRSEEQKNSYLESMTDGFVAFDKEWRYAYVNSNAAKILHKSKEELIGKVAIEVFPNASKFLAQFQQAVSTGRPVHFEEYYTDLNIWYGCHCYPSKEGLTVFFSDITETKKVEESLKESEAKFKTLAENAPDAIMRFDPDLRVLYLNPVDLAATGKTLEEFVGKTNEEMGMPPELCELWNDMFEKARKSRQSQEVEFDFDTPTGMKTFNLRIVPEFSDKGSLVSFLGISRDITERKKAEEELRESEELYRVLFDNSEYGFVLAEPIFNSQDIATDFRFIEVNTNYARQIGKEKSAAIGKRALELDPDLEPEWLAAIGEVSKTGKAFRNEAFNRLTGKWYNAQYLPFPKDRVGILFTDITKEKELERELVEKERLAAIGATAGMVGHDIRNPLQAITSDVYLAKTDLASTPDSEEKKNALESLDEIEKNIGYIDKIVQDLQDFAKPLNPHAEEVDLKRILDDLLEKNGLPKNIKVNVKVDVERIVADSTFVGRIMYNLVTNAVQAMPNGGKLTIHAYKQSNDTLITVKDTGVGIPEAVKGKLFTPMFTTKSKGQGFGLAVIKRMTEAQGGTVSFESQEGKGTIFIIRLPSA